jgi:hypothetical protein
MEVDKGRESKDGIGLEMTNLETMVLENDMGEMRKREVKLDDMVGIEDHVFTIIFPWDLH